MNKITQLGPLLGSFMLAVFIIGCEKKLAPPPDTVVVSGVVNQLADTTLNFSYYAYDFLHDLATEPVTLDKDGNFKMKINTTTPLKGWFSFGKSPVTREFSFTTVDGKDSIIKTGTYDFKMLYLYLKPGDSVHFSTDINAINTATQWSGNMNDDIKFVLEEESKFNDYKHKYLKNWYNVSQRQPDDFKAATKAKYEEKLAFLEDFKSKHQLSDDLISFYKDNLYASYISALVSYPSIYASYNPDKKLSLPSNYYDFMSAVYLKDDISKNGIGYFYGLRTYLKKKYELELEENPAVADFYDWIEGELPENLRYQYMAYSLSSDFSKRLYDAFDEESKYPEMARVVRNKYQHLEGMLEGSEAPNVRFETIEGDQVTLHSLRGKYTYIDLWATWCGPCIKEIPSLQKIEKAYHGKNIQFVSVSFDDEKDHDKWINFVKKEGLTGLQLIAKEDANTTLSETYNIKMIPRFILLDPQGKIVDATAPFPSDPTLIKLFDKLNL